MINARRGLFSAIRGFFDTDISALFPFNSVTFEKAEPAPDRPDGRRNLEGRHREIVEALFGDFRLHVSSPSESPPLGRVQLFHDDEKCADGPLDHTTWAAVGRAIRERVHATAE